MAFSAPYYHVKSADSGGQQAVPLANGSATELAGKWPPIHVMDHDPKGWPGDGGRSCAFRKPTTACGWLLDHELRFYSGEFCAPACRADLQFYRCATSGRFGA